MMCKLFIKLFKTGLSSYIKYYLNTNILLTLFESIQVFSIANPSKYPIFFIPIWVRVKLDPLNPMVILITDLF
ncbi:MAG: hypothetical protein B7Z06_00965 [Flavobacteriales bacterium 32-35-8]|nr:MAG: hypothetical protein B7Z06_00965 [Flavobacteriales bacterium 32-35-8]